MKEGVGKGRGKGKAVQKRILCTGRCCSDSVWVEFLVTEVTLHGALN